MSRGCQEGSMEESLFQEHIKHTDIEREPRDLQAKRREVMLGVLGPETLYRSPPGVKNTQNRLKLFLEQREV